MTTMDKKTLVERTSYYKAIFEFGELYGEKQDLYNCDKKWSRKLGKYLKTVTLQKEEESVIDPVYITYKYYPNNPRVINFRRRKLIKNILPKDLKKFPAIARKLKKQDFIDHIKDFKEFENKLRQFGYKNIEHFWKVCKYNKHDVPEPLIKQKKILDYVR